MIVTILHAQQHIGINGTQALPIIIQKIIELDAVLFLSK